METASAPMNQKKPSKKRIILTIIFVLINIGVIVVTAIVEFSKNASDAKEIPFLGLDFRYLLAAVACVLVFYGAETAKHLIMMRYLLGKPNFKTAFQVTVIGKYYDNVTPLGAGGQPFQIYYLSKRGLPKGAAASMPILAFITSNFGFVILAFLVFIVNPGATGSTVVSVSAWIGLLFYSAVPVTIIIFTIAPKFAEAILNFFILVLSKIRLIRDREKAQKATFTALGEYRDVIRSIANRKGLPVLGLLLLLSLVYYIALCLMPHYVLRAFGGAATWFQSFCITVNIYAAITFIPTPGNAGAAEGTFYALFSVLTGAYLFWAMLVWRFFCYYLFIIMGGVVYAYNALTAQRARRAMTGADFPIMSNEDAMPDVEDSEEEPVKNVPEEVEEEEFAQDVPEEIEEEEPETRETLPEKEKAAE